VKKTSWRDIFGIRLALILVYIQIDSSVFDSKNVMPALHTFTTKTNDIREAPAYGISEAAHYLGTPVPTLRSWVRGRNYPTESGPRHFHPLIELPDPQSGSLSFVNLVEAHVLCAIRREHRIPITTVRRALDYVRKSIGSKHPLADAKFETDGIHLFVSQFGKLISASEAGQLAVRDLITAHLRRVEHDSGGLAVRFYPFTRATRLDDPKIIVIDPYVAFGRASISGTGIVAERYKAGETIDSLAEDYGCSRIQIEEAVRCELALAA
jgi:uncharacterized protein (DUF433 family)